MTLKWDRKHFVLFLVFTGYLLCYVDRMVMATAIPYIGKDLNLSKTAMGAVMSAFFIGYVAFQIPAGVLVDRYGARKTMAFAITMWTIFTAVTGMVSNLTQMLITRVLFGLGESPYPPASLKSTALWFEPSKRGFATSIIISTNSWGPALAPLYAVAAMSLWGWRGTFYSLVIPGIILLVLISKYASDNPVLTTKDSELAVNEERRGEGNYSFWNVLSEPIVWKSTIVFFFFNIACWGFKSWLPTYLVSARHMKMQTMGIAVSLPFFAGIVGTLCGGWLSDGRFKDNRMIPVVGFQLATGILFYLMYTVEAIELVVIYQTLAGFCLSAALGGLWAIPVSAISKKLTGRAIGIFNTGGQIPGFLSPVMIGYLVDLSHGSFHTSFIFMISCIIISVVLGVTLKVRSSSED
ncbi:MAG: MFS transporter [Desulfobaccales bacterium]